MLDRVREAIFSTLTPWLPGARVLDLFAGSGSLGLEALSRGASSVRALENGPPALAALRENLRTLDLAARCEVRAGDALAPSAWEGGGFDLVFLDPPYPLMRAVDTRRSVLHALERLLVEALAPEGVLVLHVPRADLTTAALPRGCQSRLREYGNQAIWYLQPEPAGPGHEVELTSPKAAADPSKAESNARAPGLEGQAP
jgi:16S rRNA (guanine966-N2)-methyltransferase